MIIKMIFKYVKVLCLPLLLATTFDVNAQFKFPNVSSIFSSIVHFCKPHSWKSFLVNRFGFVTRPELNEQVQATQQQFNAVLVANKLAFDEQSNRLKRELLEKLQAATSDFSGRLQKVQTGADQNLNSVQGTIDSLRTLVVTQQQAFEQQMAQQFEQFNENLQLRDSEFTKKFGDFKQASVSRHEAFQITVDGLKVSIASSNETNGKTLEIVNGIQRPLTKEQRTMFKQTLRQFEQPLPEQPRQFMGPAAGLRLALPSNINSGNIN